MDSLPLGVMCSGHYWITDRFFVDNRMVSGFSPEEAVEISRQLGDCRPGDYLVRTTAGDTGFMGDAYYVRVTKLGLGGEAIVSLPRVKPTTRGAVKSTAGDWYGQTALLENLVV